MLKINHNSIDISREQSRYEYLPSSVDFSLGDILIGYYKPINKLFFNMPKNTGTRLLSIKYFSGAGFEEVKGLTDLSFGLTTPGFSTWNMNLPGEAKTTQAGELMYWYQVSLSVPASVAFRGISTVFSDDYDLIGVYPTIHNHLPEGQETFIRFHEEAAKGIITDLRRTGIVINGRYQDLKARKNIDVYDLLDKEEVREASKYFALSKIFTWLSDAPGDKWELLASKYEAEAAGSLTPLITIDKNDDGLEDTDEKLDDRVIIIGRL